MSKELYIAVRVFWIGCGIVEKNRHETNRIIERAFDQNEHVEKLARKWGEMTVARGGVSRG